MEYIEEIQLDWAHNICCDASNIPINSNPNTGFRLVMRYKNDERNMSWLYTNPTTIDLTALCNNPAYNKLKFIHYRAGATFHKFSQIAGLSNIQFPPSHEKIHVTQIKHPLFNYYPPNLLELAISGCGLEAIPTNLPKSLTRLILSGNDIQGTVMLDIKAHFPNLTYLDLSNNKIEQIGFISMSDKLATVILTDNKITDAGFICSPMEEVQLANNAITEFPASLPDTLKMLNLDRNQISKIPLEFIKRRLNDEVNFRLIISNNHSMLINFTEFDKRACIVYMLGTLLDLKNISSLEQLQNKLNNPIFDLLKEFENAIEAHINDAYEHVIDAITRECNEALYERDADIARQMEKQYGRLMMYINVLCAVVIGLCAFVIIKTGIY